MIRTYERLKDEAAGWSGCGGFDLAGGAREHRCCGSAIQGQVARVHAITTQYVRQLPCLLGSRLRIGKRASDLTYESSIPTSLSWPRS
jgi:hypothetical protein